MALPSANIRRHFLAWERPWLTQVVQWLAENWDGQRPLDLSHMLAVVPTRQSGRRLREAIASFAATQNQAAFPPRVVTPDALVALNLRDDAASRLESILAWTEIFGALDLEEFRAVFPVDPPVRNFPWALRLAQEFNRLQVTLAEAGLLLADVVERAGPDFVETERWRQIAALENEHAAQLARMGRRDPQAARIDAARHATESNAFSRIAVLAVPDLQPLAAQCLGELANAQPIDVVIFAPENEHAEFDEWGRPIPERWQRRVLTIDSFDKRVHLGADPAAQAALVARLAGDYAAPEGVLAIGVADPEVVPLLENELRRQKRGAFNPEGHPLRDEALYQLLTNLAALARDPAFSTVETLARCPDFFAYLRTRAPEKFRISHWLAGLDELRSRHLPADLAAGREHAPGSRYFSELVEGLAAIDRLRQMLRARSFAAGITEALREIFSGRQLDLARETDARWHETAAVWMEVVRECEEAAKFFPALTPDEWWDLALRLFGERRRTDEKTVGALELQGWLELLWEDAPHLVIAGMNDGRVPEALVENAFVPEGLRQRLGLETSATRLARDAYLLQAVVASRSQGRVDLLFGKTSAAGDPLRPSRLLLRCEDAELPERIAFLFRAPELTAANASWTRGWKLMPRMAPPPPKVSVTSLRRYLQCPFRFYLRNVLRMESVDPLKSELDAFDFGTLCHAALEQIGAQPALRDCTDPAVLRAELLHHLETAVRARYGRELSLPLLVQVESARQRLAKLAELQAAERAAGWVIVDVERAFEVEIAGLAVRGKIDRIDRHEGSGEVRVIDYKTSDTPVSPFEAHVRTLRPGEAVPDWARIDGFGRPHAWSDLQLPLYLRAVTADFPGRNTAGYFNLPKAAGETTLALWESYTLELHDSAMRCAEGACAAIRAGEFWPPNESVHAEWDECAALFHHGVEESVTWPTA